MKGSSWRTTREFGLEHALEMRAVGQAGEVIAQRQVLELVGLVARAQGAHHQGGAVQQCRLLRRGELARLGVEAPPGAPAPRRDVRNGAPA